jgi:site-specific DNA-methyltransferase (adenine-specific)
LPFCRLKPGEIWIDPLNKHKVGCLDTTNGTDVDELMAGALAKLAIHDPPYNLVAFEERQLGEYIDWCRQWIGHTWRVLDKDSALYVWLGADQKNHFQPLPDFMVMMREFDFKPRSFLTMRNQRGYGTPKNWMAVRQELLYYVKGNPFFAVQYTDIPKILRGYYKEVDGQVTENLERSKSNNIRPGNVWVDVQQVFYRMEENVSGCYAQKPLKSIERIIKASSRPGDLVIDFFSHSGTTLIASELNQRRCFTLDIDPVYCEIGIRRLELWRKTGRLGWQNGHPFEQDLSE